MEQRFQPAMLLPSSTTPKSAYTLSALPHLPPPGIFAHANPLVHAAANGHSDAVEALISAGAAPAGVYPWSHLDPASGCSPTQRKGGEGKLPRTKSVVHVVDETGLVRALLLYPPPPPPHPHMQKHTDSPQPVLHLMSFPTASVHLTPPPNARKGLLFTGQRSCCEGRFEGRPSRCPLLGPPPPISLRI